MNGSRLRLRPSIRFCLFVFVLLLKTLHLTLETESFVQLPATNGFCVLV